jgi:hypothetical protein
MAKVKQPEKESIVKIHKRTSQGGKAKRSSMNKGQKRSFKSYRGQGK